MLCPVVVKISVNKYFLGAQYEFKGSGEKQRTKINQIKTKTNVINKQNYIL